jgi:hypothetical protein
MGSYQLPERHYAHDQVECLVVRSLLVHAWMVETNTAYLQSTVHHDYH